MSPVDMEAELCNIPPKISAPLLKPALSLNSTVLGKKVSVVDCDDCEGDDDKS